MKTKLIIVLLSAICFHLSAAPIAHRLKPIAADQAVRAIIGEAAGEGDTGMLAVAAAIRNRGTLRGVYGVKNPIAQSPSPRTLARAQRAWSMSATNDITRGATHWENVKAFGKPYWADSLTITTNIGNHRFYK